jgi:hypothetical protein
MLTADSRPLCATSAIFCAVLGTLGPISSQGEEKSGRKTVTVRYTPADRESGRYQYVPFDVPEGTARIAFGYSYDRADGTNVVDLGLMEPGPLDLHTRAARGWTGGERTEAFVAAAEATPGYWPGPIPAGKWHVALGLYKVSEAGVSVDVWMETTPGPPAAPFALSRRPAEPLRRGARWYSGALHVHTVHSDGKLTVDEVSRLAREAGMDFLAITDHNNTVHQVDRVPADGLLRIVGEEVTTPGGHASVWGLRGERALVDYRVLPGDPRIAELVKSATAQGAVFSINHPASTCVGCGWEHAVVDGITGIEVTNGRHQEMAAAMEMWDRLLKQGRRIVAVGSSDWHRPPAPFDVASVRVWAEELSTKAILDGIRAGRVVVMADGRTPPPLLVARAGRAKAGVGETLRVGDRGDVRVDVTLPIGLLGGRVDLVADGAVVDSKPAATKLRFDRKAGDRYLRLHVFAADGAPRALTNPVFLAR